MGSSFYYSESDDQVPDKPSEPVLFPESELTHSFLVRQSCVSSSESASKVLAHYVAAAQDAAVQYTAAMSELANLYEDRMMALTEEGGERVAGA
jgi:hypothetical protein